MNLTVLLVIMKKTGDCLKKIGMFDRQLAGLHTDAMKLRVMISILLEKSSYSVDFFDEYEGV